MDLNEASRKLNIRIFSVLTIVLSILGLFFLLIHFNSNKDEIVNYNQSGNIEYDVLLTENEFFESKELEENKQYIANIIKGVNANFNYKVTVPGKFKYKYKIEADVEVIEKQTSKPLYESSEKIVSTDTRLGDNKLEIDKDVVVDYKKYNDLINKFVTTYNLKNISSTLNLNFYVDVQGEDWIAADYNTPTMTLKVPLAVNTLALETDYNIKNDNNSILIATSNEKGNIWLKIACTIWTIDLCGLLGAVLYYFSTATPEEKYKMKLKNILNSYGSYISVVEDNFDISEYKVLKVTNFVDLLEIRDTIHVPIIMVEDKKSLVTYFAIPQNEFLYYFSLTIDRPTLKGGESNIKEDFINR